MKVYTETENGIKYIVIHYDTPATQKELIQALDIIHKAEQCKVWYEIDGIKSFFYYKHGRIHKEAV